MAAGGAEVVAAVAAKHRVAFVTGNLNKAREVAEILGSAFPFEIERVDADLPELQGPPEAVARQKALEAARQLGRAVIVEDTSLSFTAWGGALPGVYIKWFLHDLGAWTGGGGVGEEERGARSARRSGAGIEGLNKALAGFEDKSAVAECIFAFCAGPDAEPILYCGKTFGSIVMPRGERHFGWDPIFQPTGYDLTYGEMPKDEKNKISHRFRALDQLRDDFTKRPDHFRALLLPPHPA
jgi:inosine triphosphate pyrophosphatase